MPLIWDSMIGETGAVLLTGAHYGELGRLRSSAMSISMLRPDAGYQGSKSRQARHVVLTDEAVGFFAPLLAGKNPKDRVFLPPTAAIGKTLDGRQYKLGEACGRARIDPPIGFHILRHTHGTMLAMKPYLWLSSLDSWPCRPLTGIQQRNIMRIWRQSYVSETIRASFPTWCGRGTGKTTVPPR